MRVAPCRGRGRCRGTDRACSQRSQACKCFPVWMPMARAANEPGRWAHPVCCGHWVGSCQAAIALSKHSSEGRENISPKHPRHL